MNLILNCQHSKWRTQYEGSKKNKIATNFHENFYLEVSSIVDSEFVIILFKLTMVYLL